MTVETRSGGDSLRKPEPRTPVLQVLDERTAKLQQFWNSKSETAAYKTDKHGVGDTSWIESLPDCPVYRPTKHEFMEDPLSYIQKIAGEASKYGICKVVSPVVASVPAGVVLSKEKSGFKFNTRLQPMRISNWDKDDKVAFPIKGRNYTLAEYEKIANGFFSRKFSTSAGLPPRFIESLFWKELVGGRTRSVEYATDVDGSAFSTARSDPLGQSKWNLKRISRLPDSVLRRLEEAIPGVTEPMLYIGMLFSMFAWHVEDHYLYSINYQHCGAPKTWYGVPGDAALDFEEVVKEHVYSRELLNDTGKGAELDLLLAKTTMFAPKLLLDHGVPVFKAVQYPGEFIITFPRAYHAGFSHGFNCGEAVNFAMADWFPWGAEACLRYEFLKRSPILPHDELLCKEATAISRKDRSGRKDSPCKPYTGVIDAFVALMRSQQQVKSSLEEKIAKSITSAVADVSCVLCKRKCYVCYTYCKCFPEPTCLNHADFFSSCSCKDDRTIVLREDFEKLASMARKYEHELKMKQQCQKLPSDTIKRKDKTLFTGAFECSLPTNVRPLKKACHKKRDSRDACMQITPINSETNVVCAIPSCKENVEEEDQSDREILKVKRRRVACTQSKRFVVEKQEVCKSLVRSLDFGSCSPVRRLDGLDIQEHLITHKQDVFQNSPVTSRDLVSVHHMVEKSKINGCAAEVLRHWQSETRTKGLTLKIKAVSLGQELFDTLSLKSVSCLKHLFSGEEVTILRRLLWKAKSWGFGHGDGNGKLVALDKWATDSEVCDNHQKVESCDERWESLSVVPPVRNILLTVKTEHFRPLGMICQDSGKKLSGKSFSIEDIMWGGGSSSEELQGIKPGDCRVKKEHAPVVEAVLDSLHPDSKSTDMPGASYLIKVENEHTKEAAVTYLESLCMEVELSAPCMDFVAECPISGMSGHEKDHPNLQKSYGSQMAESDTYQAVTSSIRKIEKMGDGIGRARASSVQGFAETGNNVSIGTDFVRENRVCDAGLVFMQQLQRNSLSLDRGVDTCQSVMPRITEMELELRQDSVLSMEPFVGKGSGAQQVAAGLADKDGICDMEESFKGNLQRLVVASESMLDESPSDTIQIKNAELGSEVWKDTVIPMEEFAEMGNEMQENTGLPEEGEVCCIKDGSNKTLRRVSPRSEAKLDTYQLVMYESQTARVENGATQDTVLDVEEFTGMGNGMQQHLGLNDNARICGTEMSDEQLKSPNTLGTAKFNSVAPVEAGQQVNGELISVTKTNFESASVVNLDEPADNVNVEQAVMNLDEPADNVNVKQAVMNRSPSVPKQGLVIYLNRKAEQCQEKSAKFSYDHTRSENDYDQVDIFEGETNGDTWSVDEGMPSFCTAENVRELTFPSEQPISMHADRFQCHLSENDGVQQSVTPSGLPPPLFQDEVLDQKFEYDGVQERFPESVDACFDRPDGKSRVMMHQHRTSFCSQGGGDFLVWEPDVIKPHTNFIQANGPMHGQLLIGNGEHNAGNVESLNPPSLRGRPLPAHSNRQQRVEPSCETFGKLPGGIQNLSELSANGLDAPFSRVGWLPWKETTINRATSHGRFKSGPYTGQYDRGCWRGNHNSFPDHAEGQGAPNPDNRKYKRNVRSSVHQHHHPYNRDTQRSTKYPRVSYAQEHAPRARWKCRGNTDHNFGTRFGRHGDAFGTDGLHVTMNTDRKVAGCSASTSEGTGYVEGYDPVKWEISSIANRQPFTSLDFHSSSSAGRGFLDL